ncbi:ras-specific guanine nucleotide-releasing factor 2 [Trichonephila clavata]|uniref:Ras-specific guanine nucleotide-releasing factor 2 n=1 Tax=Trichonephila clavata TaxID=2740835 RepID=A0A8X6F131_TRICU|nr:ras-specific guanine nucleotide-releasing factor 2 [Trichonephila clavata]
MEKHESKSNITYYWRSLTVLLKYDHEQAVKVRLQNRQQDFKQQVSKHLRYSAVCSLYQQPIRGRRSLVFRMVESEEEYVEQLQLMVSCFLRPFKMAASSQKPPCTHDERDSDVSTSDIYQRTDSEDGELADLSFSALAALCPRRSLRHVAAHADHLSGIREESPLQPPGFGRMQAEGEICCNSQKT